jgi:hypothetical protein
MAVGPYCARCQTAVRLELDGRSCSNCGAKLVTPIPVDRQRPATADEPAPARPAKPKKSTTRKGAA